MFLNKQCPLWDSIFLMYYLQLLLVKIVMMMLVFGFFEILIIKFIYIYLRYFVTYIMDCTLGVCLCYLLLRTIEKFYFERKGLYVIFKLINF